MLRIKNLSNQYQKRTLRVLYGHTQATPYAATLDPSLRETDGSFRRPLAADTTPLARSADAFVYQGGLVPGQVLVKAKAGEGAVVHNGASGVRAFGLLANFVGGNLDELGDENNIGVWYGKDAVVELLAPAFNDTSLASDYAAATAAAPVLLFPGADGRLCGPTAAAGEAAGDAVALLIQRDSASKITAKLLV
jgi:hypothetical protein